MKRLVKNIREWWGRKHPLKKLRNITTGWARASKLKSTPPDILEVSKERIKICFQCPKSDNSGLVKIINGFINVENSLYCTVCHCPCVEKSLVLDEKCPLDKWPKLI